jgi:hypothetical protein
MSRSDMIHSMPSKQRPLIVENQPGLVTKQAFAMLVNTTGLRALGVRICPLWGHRKFGHWDGNANLQQIVDLPAGSHNQADRV